MGTLFWPLLYVVITNVHIILFSSVLASTCSAGMSCGLQEGRGWDQVSGGLSVAAAAFSQRPSPWQGGWSLVSGRLD